MKILWFLIPIAAPLLASVTLMQTPFAVGQTRTQAQSPLLYLRDLVAMCENDNPAARAACGSYITGFVVGSQATQAAVAARVVADEVIRGRLAPTDEAIEAAAVRLYDQWSLFCIRSDWTAGQVQRIVVQYGREHRDLLHEMAADHMLQILAEAFPCGERR